LFFALSELFAGRARAIFEITHLKNLHDNRDYNIQTPSKTMRTGKQIRIYIQRTLARTLSPHLPLAILCFPLAVSLSLSCSLSPGWYLNQSNPNEIF